MSKQKRAVTLAHRNTEEGLLYAYTVSNNKWTTRETNVARSNSIHKIKFVIFVMNFEGDQHILMLKNTNLQILKKKNVCKHHKPPLHTCHCQSPPPPPTISAIKLPPPTFTITISPYQQPPLTTQPPPPQCWQSCRTITTTLNLICCGYNIEITLF
ncbi:hypothetical protein H5410_005896 [Solanum commersonii]|uniref:Uncharacterized protein n=1 Tax=Solanum commersonii TaxID=4109 RepID=A0A9J6A7N6_SOLCO|nr:hypothetical protein H5410_005896 [Solanum commersonii]